MSLNSPENKASFGLGLRDVLAPGAYVAVSARWVEAYDFISGSHRATKEGEGTGAFQFKDRGPLGGFTSVALNLSHQLGPNTQFGVSATNVLNGGHQESVASPLIRRLLLTEIKHTIR